MFIGKIVVHEKSVKRAKSAGQTVEIRYIDIGCVGSEFQKKDEPRQGLSKHSLPGVCTAV